MDALFDLLPLLFFLFVAVRIVRGFGRALTTGGTAPGQPQQGRPRGGMSALDQIAREIRRAVEEAERQAQLKGSPPDDPAVREVLTAPRGPAAPAPATGVYDAEFRSAEAAIAEARALEANAPDFRYVGGPDEPLQPTEFHETHAFQHGERPSAHMPSLGMPSAAMPSVAMPSLDMPGAHLHDRRASGGPRKLHPIVAALQQPGEARKAFVLQEIFGPPRSRR